MTLALTSYLHFPCLLVYCFTYFFSTRLHTALKWKRRKNIGLHFQYGAVEQWLQGEAQEGQVTTLSPLANFCVLFCAFPHQQSSVGIDSYFPLLYLQIESCSCSQWDMTLLVLKLVGIFWCLKINSSLKNSDIVSSCLQQGVLSSLPLLGNPDFFCFSDAVSTLCSPHYRESTKQNFLQNWYFCLFFMVLWWPLGPMQDLFHLTCLTSLKTALKLFICSIQKLKYFCKWFCTKAESFFPYVLCGC